VAYIEARLTKHRVRLENPQTPLEQVSALRAQIQELKTLLSNNIEE
jgi:hypothetical protein